LVVVQEHHADGGLEFAGATLDVVNQLVGNTASHDGPPRLRPTPPRLGLSRFYARRPSRVIGPPPDSLRQALGAAA
jgi:hypothetical protein